MIESWRWFGPTDPVTLDDIRQTGATDIVTALYEIPPDKPWAVDDIRTMQNMICRADGLKPLKWSVVESVPVHPEIKSGGADFRKYALVFAETLRNLGECGIRIVCYNFMPLLDWSRTELSLNLPSGAKALRFDYTDMAAFDLFILKRDAEYPEEVVLKARQRFDQMTSEQKKILSDNILLGLPGKMTQAYDQDTFRKKISEFGKVSLSAYRNLLSEFLGIVLPAAKEAGVKLAIHPDDPPFPVMGLPRIVSLEKDLEYILSQDDSPANGLTFCTGSLGAHPNNDLPAMAKKFADKVNFIHLRNTRRDPDNPFSFIEAEHLSGDTDMVSVIRNIIEFEKSSGRQIPFRPDHGHQMLDDINKKVYPGYTAIGRMKGLAEIRGVSLALQQLL